MRYPKIVPLGSTPISRSLTYEENALTLHHWCGYPLQEVAIKEGTILFVSVLEYLSCVLCCVMCKNLKPSEEGDRLYTEGFGTGYHDSTSGEIKPCIIDSDGGVTKVGT